MKINNWFLLLSILIIAFSCGNGNTTNSVVEESDPKVEKDVIVKTEAIEKRVELKQVVSEIELNTEKSTKKIARITQTNKRKEKEIKKSRLKIKKKPLKKISRKSKIQFETLYYDFGEITEGDIINFDFKFINAGNAPLSITGADASCGCATPSIPFLDIAPNETGQIGIRYNSVNKDGEQHPTITIKSNSVQPYTTLRMSGFVKPKPKKEIIEG